MPCVHVPASIKWLFSCDARQITTLHNFSIIDFLCDQIRHLPTNTMLRCPSVSLNYQFAILYEAAFSCLKMANKRRQLPSLIHTISCLVWCGISLAVINFALSNSSCSVKIQRFEKCRPSIHSEFFK